MELRISGHLSYIDRFNKMKFIYLEDDTKEKLARHGYIGDGDEFTVTAPVLPVDLVGLECSLRVKLTKYSFISTLERNRGDRVTGAKLALVDIKQD